MACNHRGLCGPGFGSLTCHIANPDCKYGDERRRAEQANTQQDAKDLKPANKTALDNMIAAQNLAQAFRRINRDDVKPKPEGLDATLAERGARYGKFTDHAAIAEAFVALAMSFPGYERLAPDMRQSFRMFADKQARILSGDPDYSDSWHDIAGYATLVDKRLKAEGK